VFQVKQQSSTPLHHPAAILVYDWGLNSNN
jgi:hypothetical protein